MREKKSKSSKATHDGSSDFLVPINPDATATTVRRHHRRHDAAAPGAAPPRPPRGDVTRPLVPAAVLLQKLLGSESWAPVAAIRCRPPLLLVSMAPTVAPVVEAGRAEGG